MTVFVDDMRAPFGRMVMCHCWAGRDVDLGFGRSGYEVAVDELLAMMDIIGVSRKWIQGHPTLSFGKHRNASWVHFDISLGKRALAVKAGAVETDRYGPLEHEARLLGNGDRLATIADLRARRALAREVLL